jgi:hypothetical protein
MKESNYEQYTIRKEPIEKGFDVSYIMEEDSKQLFEIKGKTLYKLYALLGDVDKLKDAIYAIFQRTAIPKAATDYFVEETFNKFIDKVQERRQSLFAKGVKE